MMMSHRIVQARWRGLSNSMMFFFPLFCNRLLNLYFSSSLKQLTFLVMAMYERKDAAALTDLWIISGRKTSQMGFQLEENCQLTRIGAFNQMKRIVFVFFLKLYLQFLKFVCVMLNAWLWLSDPLLQLSYGQIAPISHRMSLKWAWQG